MFASLDPGSFRGRSLAARRSRLRRVSSRPLALSAPPVVAPSEPLAK